MSTFCFISFSCASPPSPAARLTRACSVRYSRDLEEGTFRNRTSDFVFMIMFGCTLMTVRLCPWLVARSDVIAADRVRPSRQSHVPQPLAHLYARLSLVQEEPERASTNIYLLVCFAKILACLDQLPRHVPVHRQVAALGAPPAHHDVQ